MRFTLVPAMLMLVVPCAAYAQFGGPAAVSVATVGSRSLTDNSDYVGQIVATEKVAIVARVTGVLEQQLFTEGSTVKQGDLLYVLEQPPYQADLKSKQAQVAQYQAQLGNAKLTLGRAQSLLTSPAGQQSTVDTASASKLQLQAEMAGAQADADASQINLDYTEIHAPISGRIGRTLITTGNVVGATSGTLTTIVSQDPMYLTFSVPVRMVATLDLKNPPLFLVKLPDGSYYEQKPKLDYVDNSVTANTDTVLLRATVPNPQRRLIDGEFVTVTLEVPGRTGLPVVPRVALLEDQQGSYVFVVGADGLAHIRRVTLGAIDGAWAAVTSGVVAGEKVVTQGIQKLSDGAKVSASPDTQIQG